MSISVYRTLSSVFSVCRCAGMRSKRAMMGENSGAPVSSTLRRSTGGSTGALRRAPGRIPSDERKRYRAKSRAVADNPKSALSENRARVVASSRVAMARACASGSSSDRRIGPRGVVEGCPPPPESGCDGGSARRVVAPNREKERDRLCKE